MSEFTRAAVAVRYQLGAARLQAVPNGPSFAPEVYRAAAVPSSDRYIVAVARVGPRKKMALLAAAFCQAEVPGVRLLIVGVSDPEIPRGRIEGHWIEVRSSVTEPELIDLYRGASLLAYPSEAEGFWLPLLDATLFGLPAIASNRTAMPEIAGDLARCFDPTADDAVDVLATVILDNFGYLPIEPPSEAGRAAQAARFSLNRAADTFLAAIDASHRRLR